MDQVLERPAALETVPQIEATLNYLIDTGEKIVTEAGAGGTVDMRNGKPDPHKVVLHNGRPFAKDFKLEREGFRFVPHDTKVADFFDDAEVRRTYYPEMEALVKAESGAKRVVIFDHTLRTADDAMRQERKIREVVPRVHNDYTEWSAPQRVRDILPRRSGRVVQASVRRRPGVAANSASRRKFSAGDLRRAQCLRRRSGDLRAALPAPRGPNLRHHVQS